jgi:hypothetical protein
MEWIVSVGNITYHHLYKSRIPMSFLNLWTPEELVFFYGAGGEWEVGRIFLQCRF